MIGIKSKEELDIMKEGGEIASFALSEALVQVKAGVSTLEIEKTVEAIILKKGAKPSFKTVPGYAYATCINVNEGVVHGLPGKYILKRGDLVSIDLGVYLKGYHTDLSYTVEVETQKEDKFLATGRFALELAVKECREGSYLGDVSHAIQEIIESAGYTVSRDLVGHGIGKKLHESPYVPGYGKKGSGPALKEGMVFAVEVIYQKGKPYIVEDKDNWTLKTADGSLSALFEQTVAVTKLGPMILTPFDKSAS